MKPQSSTWLFIGMCSLSSLAKCLDFSVSQPLVPLIFCTDFVFCFIDFCSCLCYFLPSAYFGLVCWGFVVCSPVSQGLSLTLALCLCIQGILWSYAQSVEYNLCMGGVSWPHFQSLNCCLCTQGVLWACVQSVEYHLDMGGVSWPHVQSLEHPLCLGCGSLHSVLMVSSTKCVFHYFLAVLETLAD
jgi:hypothetical protein